MLENCLDDIRGECSNFVIVTEKLTFGYMCNDCIDFAVAELTS